MRKINPLILLFFLLVSSFSLSAQTKTEIEAYFKFEYYDSVISICNRIIKNDSTRKDLYPMLGRSLTYVEKYSEAIPYLEKSKVDLDAHDYDRGWAMCDLIPCYYYWGNKTKARENLLLCRKLNATENSVSMANIWDYGLGLNSIFKIWTIKESEHFIFHFQDSSDISNHANKKSGPRNVSEYIRACEDTFSRINNFFGTKLKGKIEFYVWMNKDEGELHLKNTFNYYYEKLLVVHTSTENSISYGLARILSANAVIVKKSTRLISEGTAANFDLKNSNNISKIKGPGRANISLLSYWNYKSRSNESYQLIGRELVHRLIDKFGKEKFMQLLEDQTYDNAKKIYGKKLDEVIAQLEKEINT